MILLPSIIEWRELPHRHLWCRRMNERMDGSLLGTGGPKSTLPGSSIFYFLMEHLLFLETKVSIEERKRLNSILDESGNIKRVGKLSICTVRTVQTRIYVVCLHIATTGQGLSPPCTGSLTPNLQSFPLPSLPISPFISLRFSRSLPWNSPTITIMSSIRAISKQAGYRLSLGTAGGQNQHSEDRAGLFPSLLSALMTDRFSEKGAV